MKITIVAFDIWGFNKLIVDKLTSNGHDVIFINSSSINYTYKNKAERIKNFFSKTFLNKNIKKGFLNNELIRRAQNLQQQDYILVINSFHFTNILEILRTKTENLITYNYDSLARIPLPKNHKTLFNKIYSFDVEDVKNNNNFNLLTNFIYLEKTLDDFSENKAFMILSDSPEREKTLNRIAYILEEKNISNFEFIVLKPSLNNFHKKIIITKKFISLNNVVEKMKNAEILIDLVRKDQTGLSFRIFEAMALNKKLITNNKTIVDYDFYNPNNILIIDDENIIIPNTFLNSKYEPLPNNIYDKYTLDHWVKTVFKA